MSPAAAGTTRPRRPQSFGDLVSQHLDVDSTFYQFDALGSTTGLTDSTGAVTDDYRYEAFGKTAASTGSTETLYQWVGQLGYRHDDQVANAELFSICRNVTST